MIPHSFNLHFSDSQWCLASCMCLLAICVSSLEKCLFWSTHFLIQFFVFLILSYMSCLYILAINPLWVFLQIFSLILWVFFILLMVSFATENPLENFSLSPPFRENQKQSLYITCCFRKGWHPRILSHTPQDILSLFLILSHVEWQREIGLSSI